MKKLIIEIEGIPNLDWGVIKQIRIALDKMITYAKMETKTEELYRDEEKSYPIQKQIKNLCSNSLHSEEK